MNPNPPVTEAELHAFVDAHLTPERQREIEAWLAHRPEEAQRVVSYRAQKRELRACFDPVLDEALPQRVLRAARPRELSPPSPPSSPGSGWGWQRRAAGVAIALVSGATGWGLRGGVPGLSPADSIAQQGPASITMASATGFAQRAAVAHAVYSPEQRRPVEVDAAHEDQLIAWLAKRMGAPMKPPHLQAVGYELEGGRLLPGGQGPVAQFMYRRTGADGAGQRLTLYVSNEIGDLGASDGGVERKRPGADPAFRFAREGPVNVFYWVEGRFGYALSADADRATLARVSGEVYRQLNATR